MLPAQTCQTGDAGGGDYWCQANMKVPPQGGGFPSAIETDSDEERAVWFSAYFQTYLERDLSQLSEVSNLSDFQRLKRIAAQRIEKSNCSGGPQPRYFWARSLRRNIIISTCVL